MRYIRQYDEMTCGVTCIANILFHYGEDNIDISKLNSRNFGNSGISGKGTERDFGRVF